MAAEVNCVGVMRIRKTLEVCSASKLKQGHLLGSSLRITLIPKQIPLQIYYTITKDTSTPYVPIFPNLIAQNAQNTTPHFSNLHRRILTTLRLFSSRSLLSIPHSHPSTPSSHPRGDKLPSSRRETSHGSSRMRRPILRNRTWHP